MSDNISKYKDSKLYLMLSDNENMSEEAFAEIYARYSQRIYAYCLRVTGDIDDAKDIFQETFMKFFDSAKDQRESIENIPGYLITIARNICLNYKRNRKRSFSLEDYHIMTNDTDYEKRELLQLLSTAIELLDFKYREAFILRQYQGMSYKEIAKITGDSLSAVKNRVWRAKEKIKEILTPYLEDMSN